MYRVLVRVLLLFVCRWE